MLLKFSKAYKNMQSHYYFSSNHKGTDLGACSLQLASPDSSRWDKSTYSNISFTYGPAEGPSWTPSSCWPAQLNRGWEKQFQSNLGTYQWLSLRLHTVTQPCIVKRAVFCF